FFDFLAVRLNGPKADGKKIGLNIIFTDTNKEYALTLDNSVLNYLADRQVENPDATIRLTRPALNDIILQRATLDELIKDGKVQVSGQKGKITELLSLFDNFDLFFNVVTP
ncbi:MAG: alkyl sulfatase C-terminal domain-containing protein, partial [Deltaproteobacteria bacterium]